MRKICLTFDVESLDLNGSWKKGHMKLDSDYSRDGLGKILRLLDKYCVKCTFFVTGEFFLKNRNLILKIYSKGHEIACHGYGHIVYSDLSLKEAAQDIISATELLRRDFDIVGFRCPQNFRFKGLYKVLNKLGYGYSSSSHNAFIPGKMSEGFKIEKIRRFGRVLEIPSSTFFGLGLSWLWFRLIGSWWVKLFISLRFRGYSVIYLHPWEFSNLSSLIRLPDFIKKGTGESMVDKLDSFLRWGKRHAYLFITMRDLTKDL